MILNNKTIKLFKNLEDINEGFRIPDIAYVFGKDFKCFEGLGIDMFFANYWYGDKLEVEKFAEKLVDYFKTEYNKIPCEKGLYDFQGMVVLWYVDNKALVANINLNSDLSFWQYEEEIPEELMDFTVNLTKVLSDASDNGVVDIIYAECEENIKKELFSCVAENYKESYINTAKDNNVSLED